MTFSVGFQAVLVLDKPIVNVKKKSDNLLIAELTINIKNWNLLHEYDCCSIEILDDNMTIMRSKDKSSIKEKKKRQK